MHAADFAVGIPLGLLTAAILFINEFPDAAADALAGKRHLVVILGKENSRWVYLGMVAAGFAACVAMVLLGLLPPGALAMLLAAPVAARATRVLFAHFRDRELIEANAATIKLHAIAGLLLTAGIAASIWI